MVTKYNELISICIPTYNRCNLLDDFLSDIVPILEKKKISIIISDNCSSDSTSDVVKSWMNTYKGIFYHVNDSNLGAEKNFLVAQSLATTKYVWLIGDDDRLVKENLEKILVILSRNNYDYLIVNGTNGTKGAKNRINNIDSKEYRDADKLLNDLGWHMAWISCVIVRRDNIDENAVKKYLNTRLSRVGSLFEQLSYNTNCFWFSDQAVYVQNDQQAPVGYMNDVFEIFISDFCEIADNLPDGIYTKKAKLAFTRGHNDSVFKLKNFINYRVNGIYNFKKYLKYSRNFLFVTTENRFILLFISIVPPIVFRALITVSKVLHAKKLG